MASFSSIGVGLGGSVDVNALIKASVDAVKLSITRPNGLNDQIKLTDANGDFCYELPCPAGQALTLHLYGYPEAPAEAAATLRKDGQTLDPPVYKDGALTVPPLEAGRYRLRVTAGSCTDEVILRVGDPMLWQRGLQWLERHVRKAFPSI